MTGRDAADGAALARMLDVWRASHADFVPLYCEPVIAAALALVLATR